MAGISKNKVSIYKSREEFEVIDERVKSLSKHDLNTYVRGEVHKLLKRFNECPELIIRSNGEKKTQRSIYIQDTTMESLKRLSVIMNKPFNTIVDDYIIKPLLLPNFAAPQD